MAEFEVDERVDITDVVCPMTFVKAKVAMEELENRFRMCQEVLRKKDSRF